MTPGGSSLLSLSFRISFSPQLHFPGCKRWLFLFIFVSLEFTFEQHL